MVPGTGTTAARKTPISSWLSTFSLTLSFTLNLFLRKHVLGILNLFCIIKSALNGLLIFMTTITDEKAYWIQRIRKNGYTLSKAPLQIRSDKDCVISAVTQNGTALEFASLDLKNDEEVVAAACRENGLALAFASALIQANKDIVHIAVDQDGRALTYAAPLCKRNREIILRATLEPWGVTGGSVRPGFSIGLNIP